MSVHEGVLLTVTAVPALQGPDDDGPETTLQPARSGSVWAFHVRTTPALDALPARLLGVAGAALSVVVTVRTPEGFDSRVPTAASIA
ncbi:hypothetical protein [Pengzhenrongella sicca]|uniref:hypothetical protein n=1 Tax=Pengzhenrongella sicca TaxID=2819238 RepID=UPI001D0BFAAB|nr:hypothetical protein [Pengzhenrongella sicca]